MRILHATAALLALLAFETVSLADEPPVSVPVPAPAATEAPAPPTAEQPTAPPPAVAPAPAAAPPETAAPPSTKKKPKIYGQSPDAMGERALTWDLNIDGAFGRAFGDVDKPAGFARIRGGILRIREPLFLAVGATYEFSSFTPATFGVQAEAMHLSTGLWIQAGAMIDVQPKPGVMAAVGWSLLGAEIQYRSYDKYGLNDTLAFYGKIRIPISIISWALREHEGDHEVEK